MVTADTGTNPTLTFQLELCPVGACTPEEAVQRLRRALKALLRAYGLRAVWVKGVEDNPHEH